MVFHLKRKNQKIHHIALFLPPDSPAVREIQNGFLDTLLQNKIEFQFCAHNTSNNIKEDERTIKKLIKQKEKYSLIFTIGIECTKIAKKVTIQEKKLIPIVFSSVANQVKERLTQTEKYSNNHLTGTFSTQTDLAILIRYLLWLKPDIKKITYLYDISFYNPLIDKSFKLDANMIKGLHQKNISINRILLRNKNEIISKLSDHHTDVLITTRGHLFLSQINFLTSLAHQYNIPLCTSDHESVKHGATLGIGDSEYKSGALTAANHAIPILTRSTLPAQIPLTKLTWDYRLMLNTHSIFSQKTFPPQPTLNKVLSLENSLLI